MTYTMDVGLHQLIQSVSCKCAVNVLYSVLQFPKTTKLQGYRPAVCTMEQTELDFNSIYAEINNNVDLTAMGARMDLLACIRLLAQQADDLNLSRMDGLVVARDGVHVFALVLKNKNNTDNGRYLHINMCQYKRRLMLKTIKTTFSYGQTLLISIVSSAVASYLTTMFMLSGCS